MHEDCREWAPAYEDSVLKIQQKRGHGKQLERETTGYRTMTQKDSNRTAREIKAMIAGDGEFLRPMVVRSSRTFSKRRWQRLFGRKKENE
jgi:hypothetical protein